MNQPGYIEPDKKKTRFILLKIRWKTNVSKIRYARNIKLNAELTLHFKLESEVFIISGGTEVYS